MPAPREGERGRAGDARFEAVLEGAPDSIVGVSSDGRIAFVNREAERAFGYSREELVGEPVEVLLPERFRDGHALHRRGYIACPRRRPMGAGLDLVGRRRDGSEFPVEISLSPVEGDPDLRVTAVIRDVTDRRRAERRLRESERQLKLAQRVAAVGSWIMNPATRSVRWSDQLYELCGLEHGDPRAEGASWFAMVHEEDRGRFRAAIRESVARRSSLAIELRVVRPNGSIRTVDCRAEVVTDPDDQGFQLIGTVQDITARREAQRSVEEQHAFLHALLAQAGEAIVACDAEGQLVLVNEAARRLTGIERLEVALASWGTAYDSDGALLALEDWPISRALAGETTLAREIHLVRPDGMSYDLLVSAAPVRAADGVIVGAIATAPEFTERKRAERRLRESEERYRGLVEASPDGIAIHRGGNLVYVNPAGVRLLGGERPEDVVGQPLLRFVDPESAELVRRRIRQMTERGEPVGLVEETLRRLDGQPLHAEVVALPTSWAGEPAIQAVVRDVTERKRAVRALRESERRLSTLISNLSGIVYRCRDDGRWTIEFVSDGALSVLGLQPDDLVGQPARLYRELIHPADRRRVKSSIARALGESRPFQITYRLRHPSGAIRWVWEQGRAVPGDDGRVAAVEGFITDVTDRQRALEALERARDDALAASRLKSIFLSTISHEIRTPLNVILGYTALMAEEGGGAVEDDGRRDMLEGIERAGKRLVSTVHQILDYSRIEAGDFPVDPAPLDVGAVLGPVLAELGRTAQGKGLEISWRNEAPDASVQFDAVCLVGAVRSLVDNAVKFTLRGSVRVTLRRDLDGSLLLEVADTGVGIAAEYLPRIFEPFNQEVNGYTRPFEGAGIGLALARRYLELNGAHLRVESRKGEGSIFTIRFPRALEAGEGTRAQDARGDARRPSILIVDEDEETRRFLEQVLGPRFEVLTAATGRMARRQLASHRGEIEAIVVDLSLGGSEDALSLTRWLREQSDWHDIPVIATTAHDSPEDRQRALEAGCTDLLAKPLAFRHLVQRIRHASRPTAAPRRAVGH